MPNRRHSESGFYHVMLRGNARQVVFRDDEDRSKFVGILDTARRNTQLSLVAWCLMDNHVHLVFSDPKDELSSVMHRLALSYARYFNRRYGRTGHVFEGRFKSLPIETDEYLLQVVRYVMNNPVAAGIGTLDNYHWSSYPEYLGEIGLADTGMILDMFESIEAFDRFCRDGTPQYDARLESDVVSDEQAPVLAGEVVQRLGIGRTSDIAGLPRGARDVAVRELRRTGLTAKQVARVTGISLPTVYRIIKK